MMTKIKRAISPLKPRHEADDSGPSSVAEHTPLTRFVMNKLTGPSKELFALSFAVQMRVDKHALVFDLADCLPWIGIGRIDNAVRLLTKHFTEGQYRVETIFLPREENSSGRGRRPVRHLISLDILEDLMMQAETEQGRNARAMYKQLRDAVQDYMQIEMEAASRAATEREKQAQQQLDESNAQRAKLEAVQAKLQATIESQKKRDEKKEARKRQQKEPMETAYIMTNMPDDNQGPYKCGKTGGDAKKRAKEMQTGNHEEMRVVASVKCVDSKLVEDVMHRIFRDYRTNDKLEWFDTNLKSMKSVLNFVVRIIDGLNCVDHDSFCVDVALDAVLASMEESVFKGSLIDHHEPPMDGVIDVGGNMPSMVQKNVVDDWFHNEVEHESLPKQIHSKDFLAQINSSLDEKVNFGRFKQMLEPYLQSGCVQKRENFRIGSKTGNGYDLDMDKLKHFLISEHKMDPCYA